MRLTKAGSVLLKETRPVLFGSQLAAWERRQAD